MEKKAKKTERQEKTEQVDRGRTKGVDEEAERTFKKVKMLNRRRNTPFLCLKKKSKNGSCREKRGFFQMTGKYVKGENEERTEKG